MNKLKLACVSLGLAMGVAHAATAPCNGFEIKVKNNFTDDFLIHKVNLEQASLQPAGIQKLNANSEQVFTVNQSVKDKPMTGSFEFHTISLPTKKVTINFTLKNKGLVCVHDDQNSGGDIGVKKTRLPGKVTYTIG